MSYNLALSSSVPPYNFQEESSSLRAPFTAVIVRPVARTVLISRINKHLRLETPVSIPVKMEDGYYTADFKIGTFVIASCEETKEALAKDLRDQFLYAWDYYAREVDNNLTGGARIVKNWLRDNIVED